MPLLDHRQVVQVRIEPFLLGLAQRFDQRFDLRPRLCLFDPGRLEVAASVEGLRLLPELCSLRILRGIVRRAAVQHGSQRQIHLALRVRPVDLELLAGPGHRHQDRRGHRVPRSHAYVNSKRSARRKSSKKRPKTR